MNLEQIQAERLKKKRKALTKFKAAVRLVILNKTWLSEQDESFGTELKKNIDLVVRRKRQKGILSLAEKAILKKNPDYRTAEENRQLLTVITTLKCFSRYPPIIRGRLARASYYFYFPAEKIIVKEGHPPSAMYFILDGEIEVSKKEFDPITNEYVSIILGILEPGEMFGEVALLQNITRTATCTANTNVELLCIYSDDFDKILRQTLQRKWDQIQAAINRFECFKNWTRTQLLECCSLAKIKQYTRDQVIYYDQKGAADYAYFVLSGECSILQCLKIKKRIRKNVTSYILCNFGPIKTTSKEQLFQSLSRAQSIMQATDVKGALEKEHYYKEVFEGYTVRDKGSIPFEILQKESKINVRDSRLSLRGSKMSMRSDSSRDLHMFRDDDEGAEHHFMDVGTITCGGVFGLGECMDDRVIYAKDTVQCLLIPRYWLFGRNQNANNKWRRTQMYLNNTIPSREKLFQDFLATKKWNKFKKRLLNQAASEHKKVSVAEDIPIICRILSGQLLSPI